MFNIPVKEIIVNNDSQVVLLEDDGTAYSDNDIVADTSGGFILDGFIEEVIWASRTLALTKTAKGGKNSYVRFYTGSDCMLKTAYSAGTAEIAAYTVTAAGGAKYGDTYRLVVESLDLTPTEYQNRPIEKRYQLSVNCAAATNVITELVSRINGDPTSPVTAVAGFDNTGGVPDQNDETKIILIAKKTALKINLYVGSYADSTQTAYTVSLSKAAAAVAVAYAADTTHTTVAPALSVGTYDAVKNINWSKNFDIDVNVNWMPLPGANYNAYYFEVGTTQLQSQAGNDPHPGELTNDQVYAVRLYVKSGTTLDTAMTLLEGDVG
jgi:hypothetical protein